MTHFFQFEQLDRRDREPRQEFEHISRNKSRSPLPTAAQLTRIFSAFIGSLVIVLSFTIFQPPNTQAVVATYPLLMLALQVIFAGTMLATGAVLFAGIPLAVVAWRATPRTRFLFAVPFLTCALLLLVSLLIPFLHIGRFLGPIFFIVGLFYGIPIISTIAINRVIRQIALPDKLLRFARFLSPLVVFVLTVMFLWLLAWGVYTAVFAPELFLSFLTNPPYPSWLITLIGMLICVIVAAQATSSQPRQYDDSLHNFASNREQAQPPADPTGE
jgi:hypothetical protein